MLYALWLPGLNFWRKFQPRQLSPIQEQGYYTLRSFTPIDGGEKQAILIFTYQLLLLLPCKTATATGDREGRADVVASPPPATIQPV